MAGVDDDGPDAEPELASQGGPCEVRVSRGHLAFHGRLGLVGGGKSLVGRRRRRRGFRFARVDVDDQPERVEEMIDPVGLDPRELDVDDDADRRGRFLRDPDLADVLRLDRVGLALKDGVELGLEDVDIDPAGVLELAGSVLAELADVEDDAGKVRMGVAAEVDDLDPRVVLGRGGEEDGEAGQDREERPYPHGLQFILIL